jgi:hypothetical protein
MDKIEAPFTDEQVAALNKYQWSGVMHPFTCARPEGLEHSFTEEVLRATRDGWVCVKVGCTYTQKWAHEFMADSEWIDEQIQKYPFLHGGPEDDVSP